MIYNESKEKIATSIKAFLESLLRKQAFGDECLNVNISTTYC